MSDLAATNCRGCSCGCESNSCCNNFIWIIVLLLLFNNCGGSCGNGCGSCGGGLSSIFNGGCGDSNCSIWIIILILIFFCGCN